MNELDMNYEMSKLEGINCHIAMEDSPNAYLYSEDLSREIDYITDLALNCMLRDKYKIEIEYVTDRLIYIAINEYETNEKYPITSIKTASTEGIPRAVCECILKSQGLWE